MCEIVSLMCIVVDQIQLNIVIMQIEKELNSICGDVLEVLEKHLIPAADAGESKVFYYKM